MVVQGTAETTSPPPPAPSGGGVGTGSRSVQHQAVTGAGAGAAAGAGANGGRTAGDVLNDIGTMLADLTDELDAMLQLERNAFLLSFLFAVFFSFFMHFKKRVCQELFLIHQEAKLLKNGIECQTKKSLTLIG